VQRATRNLFRVAVKMEAPIINIAMDNATKSLMNKYISFKMKLHLIFRLVVRALINFLMFMPRNWPIQIISASDSSGRNITYSLLIYMWYMYDKENNWLRLGEFFEIIGDGTFYVKYKLRHEASLKDATITRDKFCVYNLNPPTEIELNYTTLDFARIII
jgi:hypothetical protein